MNASADRPSTARHLLVVDDDDRIRALLKEYLARSGFRVTTAADAAGARRQLAVIDFDLMILDVMMPGEDGFSLIRWLRGGGPARAGVPARLARPALLALAASASLRLHAGNEG